MADSKKVMLAYLKSGRHLRPYTPSCAGKPITVGPKHFASHIAAYRYVKQLLDRQIPDVLFEGEDLEIIQAVIRRHPNWGSLQRRWTFIGFTVEPHCGAHMLTGIVPKAHGHGGRVDISISRCFNIDKRLLHAPSVTTKSVYRQDDVDWMIAA